MPTEKKVLVFDAGEICYSTNAQATKCVVIKHEGDRVLVVDDPTLLNAKGEVIPSWYPADKLRGAVKGEEGFSK